VAIFVPEGTRKQALDAVGVGLSGLFSDLPPIFAGDVAQEGLQVEQSVLTNFGADKQGCQTLMQQVQAQHPGANQTQVWRGRLGYGILMRLHAGLLSDGRGN
jgi:hypothetical protein